MNDTPYPAAHPDGATLSAYHDGELRGFARADVDAHLAECARCHSEIERLDALDGALRALPALDPPEGVRDAVLARVSSTRTRHPRRRVTLGVAAAVAALAALIGGYDIFVQPIAGPQVATVMHAPATHAARGLLRTNAPQPANMPGTGGTASSSGVQFGTSAQALPAKPAAPMHAATSPTTSAAPKRQAAAAGGAMGDINPIDARLIARSGEVDLRVRDVQRSFDAVTAIATRQHGYVSDSNNNAAEATGGQYAATLTLRVPAANYQAAIDALAALPHTALTERSTSSDVTDSYHNLQAQLQALQTTRAQLTALMRQAHSVRDALTVLDQLTQIDTQIDGVQGQIMATSNTVMLATIAVNLTRQPKPQVVLPPGPKPRPHPHVWQPGRDLAAALDNVRLAVQAIVSAAIYAAVYLALPALLLALALAVRRLRRWSPRRT